MRLLFITQKMDKDDDVLGVYHHWIEELAKKIDKLSVICLYRGRIELPNNVFVYSLGKEKLRNWEIGKLSYLWNFYKYLYRLRGNYDAVFVHMNPEYILLGGLFWKLLGKKIFLWYNHPLGGLKVRLAAKFCQKVFHTSPFAYAARFSHSQIMPAGIDTDIFKRDFRKKEPNSIFYLGRISPVKNLDCLIEAAKILRESGVAFYLSIVGSPINPEDYEYEKKIKSVAKNLIDSGFIKFMLFVSNQKVPELYNQNELVVNLTDTGSLDKAMLEAMACGCLVLTSNKALQPVLPPEFIFQEKNSQNLAEKIVVLLKLTQTEKENYGRNFREYVIKNHDLKILIDKLISKISN